MNFFFHLAERDGPFAIISAILQALNHTCSKEIIWLTNPMRSPFTTVYQHYTKFENDEAPSIEVGDSRNVVV